MKIALVHDFLTQLGGAERVLQAFLEIWPDTPVYTAVFNPERTAHQFDKYDIRTSFVQQLPFGVAKYKWYLPLYPKAYESWDLSAYDVILSDVSGMAKGVRTRKGQLHICFLHTPTRYLWSDRESYLGSAPVPFFIRPFMPNVIKKLQKWDLQAAKHPNYYIVNSNNVAKRLEKYYKRKADSIIHPPVETKKFYYRKSKGYFFASGRIEPYKRFDLLVEAFNMLESPLVIAGTGSYLPHVRARSKKNIQFVGRVSDAELAKLYAECEAYIFPTEEDAGIAPVEAMASGKPVIAYKKGGVIEAMREKETGIYFSHQTANSLMQAIWKFDRTRFDPQRIQRHAATFDKALFKRHIHAYIVKKVKEHGIT